MGSNPTPQRYHVVAARTFERDIKKVQKSAPKIYEALLSAVNILEKDPANLQAKANIRKLVGIPAGEGQYRLRISDYRLRYDIEGDTVILHSMRPRGRSYR